MGHRKEKRIWGSMKKLRHIANISKVSVSELTNAMCGWKPPKIGKTKEGDARINAPRFWNPRPQSH